MREDSTFSSSGDDDATDISRSKRQEHLRVNYRNDHLLLKRGKVSCAKEDIKTNLGGNWKRNHGAVGPAASSFILLPSLGLRVAF